MMDCTLSWLRTARNIGNKLQEIFVTRCKKHWLRTARNIGNTLAHCNWHTLHEMLFAHCKRTFQKILGTHLPSSSQSKYSQCFHKYYFQESFQPLIPCMMLFKNYISTLESVHSIFPTSQCQCWPRGGGWVTGIPFMASRKNLWHPEPLQPSHSAMLHMSRSKKLHSEKARNFTWYLIQRNRNFLSGRTENFRTFHVRPILFADCTFLTFEDFD